MKKAYVTPEIEKIEFQYRDQVVATSGGIVTNCQLIWYDLNTNGQTNCHTKEEYVNNEGPN